MPNAIDRIKDASFEARSVHEFETLMRWSGITETRNGIYKSLVLSICNLACNGLPAERFS